MLLDRRSQSPHPHAHATGRLADPPRAGDRHDDSRRLHPNRDSYRERDPPAAQPWWPAFTPDGSLAFVANQNADNVSVVDVATYAVVATIPTGANPFFVSVAPDGSSAWVCNHFSCDVTIVGIPSLSVLATLAVGGGGPWYTA